MRSLSDRQIVSPCGKCSLCVFSTAETYRGFSQATVRSPVLPELDWVPGPDFTETDPHPPGRLWRRLPVSNLHLELTKKTDDLLRITPLRRYHRASSSGEFSLIQPGTKNPVTSSVTICVTASMELDN